MEDRIALHRRHRTGRRNRRRVYAGRCRVSAEIEVSGEESGGENSQPDENENEEMQTRPVLPSESGGGRRFLSRGVSRLRAVPGPRTTRAERAFDAPRLLLERNGPSGSPVSRACRPVGFRRGGLQVQGRSFHATGIVAQLEQHVKSRNVIASWPYVTGIVIAAMRTNIGSNLPRLLRCFLPGCRIERHRMT